MNQGYVRYVYQIMVLVKYSDIEIEESQNLKCGVVYDGLKYEDFQVNFYRSEQINC